MLLKIEILLIPLQANSHTFSGAASAIIGGANSHIFVFTDHKNNGFQKKLIMQNTKI
jgi:hypothetical protein